MSAAAPPPSSPQADWILRIVQPDSREPAAGVPVTILGPEGTPSGYWVSDAHGSVAVPPGDAPPERLWVRVGLRNEEPIELARARLDQGEVVLEAPRTLVPMVVGGGGSSTAERAPVLAPSPQPPANSDPPGQVLYFVRLGVCAPAPPDPRRDQPSLFPPAPFYVPPPSPPAGRASGQLGGGSQRIDFFRMSAGEPAIALRYGVLLEIEQQWQSLGCLWGDLLYSVFLAPGDEARVALLDGRWRDPSGPLAEPADEWLPRERPLDVLARMITGAPAVPIQLGGGSVAGDGAGGHSLEPFPLPVRPRSGGGGGGGGDTLLSLAVVETVRDLCERVGRSSHALRHRPFHLTEVRGETPPPTATAVRTVRNAQRTQALAYHFFEPLERFRVRHRTGRVRPVVLVPFRLPELATRTVVRQFAHILRRALLDRTLLPELESLLRGGTDPAGGAPPVSELRLMVHPAPQDPPLDPRRLWCFLHADAVRYTVHFFPATPQIAHAGSAPPGAPPRATHWIGAIRLADFHQHPLRFPGQLSLENGSTTTWVFETLHLEGRVGDGWKRLATISDLVFPAQSRVQLTSLAALWAGSELDPRDGRLLAHIGANLVYYAAAIISAGDPRQRYLALSKLRDPLTGRSLTDLVENTVVGVVGSHIALPLRAVADAPPELQEAFALYTARPPRISEDVVVTVPVPGIWLSTQAASAAGAEPETAAEEPTAVSSRRVRRP